MPNEYTNNFNQIQDAIIDNKHIKITYKDYHEQSSTRVIKPIRFEMVERKSNFYDRLCIKGYCNLRKEDRVFAIFRIKDLKIL